MSLASVFMKGPAVIPPVLPTYARADLAFERGEGCYLVAENGQRYLDFGAGIAVNALGHAHPALVKAVTDQAAKLWHTSNLYRIPGGEKLAMRLTEATFADTVFFTNSGAEALECAIKMARKFQSHEGHPERFHIVTFEGAFHGRTYAAINAGGNEKYLEGFGPKMPGFDQVPAGDIAAVKKVVGPQTAAIISANTMVSASAVVLASWIASRRLPAPASLRFVTVNVISVS